ncbi:MAG: twin-arginine translocase TatA/TatE family subunit [Propioniciclava sp.]
MPINMQGWEWVILILLALLIFGGSRLAGAGKNAGKALREFREETRQIKVDDEKAKLNQPSSSAPADAPSESSEAPEIVEAELVDPKPEKRDQS